MQYESAIRRDAISIGKVCFKDEVGLLSLDERPSFKCALLRKLGGGGGAYVKYCVTQLGQWTLLICDIQSCEGLLARLSPW